MLGRGKQDTYGFLDPQLIHPPSNKRAGTHYITNTLRDEKKL